MTNDGRRLWFSLALVLALGITLSGYYFVHRPVTLAQAAVLAGTFVDTGVAFLLTALGGGLGQRLLRGWPIAASGERVAVHAALGWGMMGLAMLALGVANLYHPPLIWALVLLLFVSLWRSIRRWLADLSRAFAVFGYPDRFARLAVLFVLCTLALGWLQALAPPFKWDALVYHLTLPQLYAQTRGIRLEADFFFSGMPQLTEMLYTAAFLLRGEIAAQTLGWVFGAVLTLGLAAYASEAFGPRLASLAPALLLSSSTIAISHSWAYADLLLMLLALAMLVTLRRWSFTHERRWLLLSGVLAGLAMGCKYTGVILPFAAVAVIVLDHFRSRSHPPTPPHPITLSTRHLVTLSLSFLFISFLFFTPWLLKNWFFTGSPTYPLLIPTPAVDKLRLWFYNRPDLTERNPVWAALIFFRVIFLGVQGANNYDATLSPWLVFLPLALALGWRRLDAPVRRELSPLVIFVLASYALWVILTFVSYYAVQARLFFSLFPALSLLCLGGELAAAQFDSPGLRLSTIVQGIIIFAFGLSTLEYVMAFAAHNPLAYLAGRQTASEYRAANLGWYTAGIDRVNTLPAGSRVVFLWEPRSLECASPSRCVPDLIIDRWWRLRRTVGTAEAAMTRWKSEGITHVLIYDLGLQFVRSQPDSPFEDSDWAELDRLRSQLPLLENIGGAYSLYALP